VPPGPPTTAGGKRGEGGALAHLVASVSAVGATHPPPPEGVEERDGLCAPSGGRERRGRPGHWEREARHARSGGRGAAVECRDGRRDTRSEARVKCWLYMSPVERQRWAFFWTGSRALFLEAGLIVCPPPKIDLWKRAP